MFGRVLLLLALVIALNAPAAAQPEIGGCAIFPYNNAWNTDISKAPVHPRSAAYIATINANGGDYVHPDFGENPSYGIPWITVDDSQPLVPITFDYDDESDPGPYPFPPDAPVEAGSDRHVLVLNTDSCRLYETWDSTFLGGPDNAWHAGSGAIFDLNSNALRPDGWTSADAAGLPILPGLARCEEANSGKITHALRFTVSKTQRAYIYPATHYASSITDPNYPPMGLRFRLKASYDVSGLTGQALTIALALKKYGMIVADNGSNWYISGETNPTCWNDDELNQLKRIPGTAFEVIVSPPSPDALSAVPVRNVYTTRQPVLMWNPVTWAVRYAIEINGGTLYSPLTDANIPTPAFSPAAPLDDGVYTWRIRAQNALNQWGAWSTPETFVVDA